MKRGGAFSAPPPYLIGKVERLSGLIYHHSVLFSCHFISKNFICCFVLPFCPQKGKKIECTEMNVVIYHSSVSFVFMSFCFEVFYSCYFVLLQVCCYEKGKCMCLVQGEKSCFISFT